jgi:sterol desaturase/sphingolipid hydroxylase (fatty acid hydroxylase superfamily)
MLSWDRFESVRIVKGVPMRLSRFSYYSDFMVYPLVLAVLITAAVWHGSQALRAGLYQWLPACLCGLAFWSLLEYALHRVALHLMPYFSTLHKVHHAEPLGFIGTPAWISITVWLVVILLPLSSFLAFNIADGATVGVMLGYWWYGIVHHLIHHHTHSPGRESVYIARLRAWHMRHHHSPRRGNFGVTSSVWDHLFGTAISARQRKT